ncbi:hypothetical protein BH24ACI2_BH24ACI2_11570 [soil metagenome]
MIINIGSLTTDTATVVLTQTTRRLWAVVLSMSAIRQSIQPKIA